MTTFPTETETPASQQDVDHAELYLVQAVKFCTDSPRNFKPRTAKTWHDDLASLQSGGLPGDTTRPYATAYRESSGYNRGVEEGKQAVLRAHAEPPLPPPPPAPAAAVAAPAPDPRPTAERIGAAVAQARTELPGASAYTIRMRATELLK